MRAMLAGAWLTLALQVILALAFWGGSVWLGGVLSWPWSGIAMAVGTLAVLAALLAGDLEIDYDSSGQRVDIRIGWLALITSREREDPPGRITRTRVLFVRWTKVTDAAPADSGGDRAGPRGGNGARRSWFTRLSGASEPMSRALSAAAPALHELIWNSREMKIQVDSPTQVGIADRALAGLLGHRRLGPLEIQFGAARERGLVAHYRIRLYRATLTAVAALIQGRPDRAVRAMEENDRVSNRRGEPAARRE